MRGWQVVVRTMRNLGQDLTYACKIPWSLTIVKNSIWVKLPLHKQTRILRCWAAQIRLLKGIHRRVNRPARVRVQQAWIQPIVHRVNSKHLSQLATTVLLVKSIRECPWHGILRNPIVPMAMVWASRDTDKQVDTPLLILLVEAKWMAQLECKWPARSKWLVIEITFRLIKD